MQKKLISLNQYRRTLNYRLGQHQMEALFNGGKNDHAKHVKWESCNADSKHIEKMSNLDFRFPNLEKKQKIKVH